MDKPRLDQGPDYERGFIDGMMYQTQSSVDKAVNRMAQEKTLQAPHSENEIGLDYQPDWKEEYQKAVDLHCITLDELHEATVEIKRLKAMVESQDMVLVPSAERIIDLSRHILQTLRGKNDE